MAIRFRDPDDHDPGRKGKKQRDLKSSEVSEVAQAIHLELRHRLQNGSNGVEILNAAVDLIRGRQDRRGSNSSKGGKVSGEAKKDAADEEWREKCVARAKTLLSQGRHPRELAGILAPSFGKDKGTIRRCLKKAGVK